MKAITIGLGIAIVALVAVIQFGSSANADCPADCSAEGEFMKFMPSFPSFVVTDMNRQFAIGADSFGDFPTKNGAVWVVWCTESETDPWIGAMEIVTESTEMECFDGAQGGSIAVSPEYFYPSDCEDEEIDVAVAGEVIDDLDCEDTTLVVQAFVWSPLLETPESTCNVHTF